MARSVDSVISRIGIGEIQSVGLTCGHGAAEHATCVGVRVDQMAYLYACADAFRVCRTAHLIGGLVADPNDSPCSSNATWSLLGPIRRSSVGPAADHA